MWNVIGTNITMAEKDYGIQLPITVNGTQLTAQDSIRITIKNVMNGMTILVKDFDGITNNTFDLELTEEETELFAVGSYVYSMDWYQDGEFMCNIIPVSSFKVVDKA